MQALPAAVQPTVVIASVAFSRFDALGIDDASVTRHIEQADTEAALRVDTISFTSCSVGT